MNPLTTFHPWQLGRIFRVRDWFYLLGIPALAMAPFVTELSVLGLGRVLGYAIVFLAWGYGFNNFFDCDEDIDAKNLFRNMDRTSAIQLIITMTIVFMAAGVKLGLFVETSLVLAVNAAYSVPPLRLKRFLLPSLIANGFFFGSLYYASAKILRLEEAAQMNAMAAFVFVLFLPFQYVHFLADQGPLGGRLHNWEKWGLAGVLVPLLLLVTLSGVPEMFPMRFLAVGFSISALGLMFNVSTPQQMRVYLRLIGIVVGLFLLVERTLNSLT